MSPLLTSRLLQSVPLPLFCVGQKRPSTEVSMATPSQLNIGTTYYESFLALSLCVRVGKRQLKMETSRGNQLPALRYRDISFTSEYLKDSLSAVCSLMGVHNVARVRQGALPLFEVDFTEEKALDKFCRSLSNGTIHKRLRNKFKEKCGREIEVMLKLHLILPKGAKKNPSSIEVTTNNYQECFSLLKETALFEFGALNIGHMVADEESIQQDIDINDLGELLSDLNEMAAFWFTVGLHLKLPYSKLEVIRKDHRDSMDCLREMLATWLQSGEASTAELVHALKSAGMSVLSKKMAVKHGVTIITTAEPRVAGLRLEDSSQSPLSLRMLTDQRDGIATKDMQYSDLNEQLVRLKEKETKVDRTLQEAKSSLGSVKAQINELKCEQESLIEKREKKRSSWQWLQKQKASNFGDELAQINQMIKDIEETVSELSTQIDELEKKINTQNKHAEQMKIQLVQKAKEKEQLESKMNKIQQEKIDLECELEEDRRKFESEMRRMHELESKHAEELSAERLLNEKEKEQLESKIQKEKMDLKLELNRNFENEMQKMKYELKLIENKVEMMSDELDHKLQLELAQVTKVPTASQPIPGKHNDHIPDEVIKCAQTVQAGGNATGPTTGDTLVFDNGSYSFKAGLACHDAPPVKFQSNVYDYVHLNPFHHIERKRWGIKRGEITDWDAMEEIWDRGFNELDANPEEHPVLLTDPMLDFVGQRERMVEIMFEKFNIPAISITKTAYLSLLSYGFCAGTVIESGDGISCVATINNGDLLNCCCLDIAGFDLSEHLVQLCQTSSPTSLKTKMITTVKKKLCYVAQDFDHEMQTANTTSGLEMSYELPDGQVLTLNSERFRCPEPLFKPSLLGRSSVGIHEACYNCIMSTDCTNKKVFFENIVLAGGSTMFPGFSNRMQKEMSALEPCKNWIFADSDSRWYSTWIGGALLASSSSFQPVFKQDYYESGASSPKCSPRSVNVTYI